MSVEDKSNDPARVVDLSGAKNAMEEALDEPMSHPGNKHPAFRVPLKRQIDEAMNNVG